MKKNMDRRQFVKNTTLTAAAMGVPMRAGKAGWMGANDRVRIAIIGLRQQGLVNMRDFCAVPGVEIAALCDVDESQFGRPIKVLEDMGRPKPKICGDMREIFDDKDIDAVSIATPNHWHALATIWACQAGKDVHVEKPGTHNIFEGQKMIEAARKYNRIVQTGTQQRSMPINRHASQLVREGAIGKVHTVVVCNFEGPKYWTPKPGQPVPEGLNWDRWCNQTELRPYHPDLHYGWAQWWDYDGGGQSWGVSGWGTHSLDQVQCALGTDDTGPVEIRPEEKGENCKVTLRYANGTLVKLEGARRQHEDLGAIFIGDKGKIEILRGDYIAEPKELRDNAPDPTPEGPHENDPHLRNFFECIRTRQLPNADVEIGHRSTTVCHLINICRELGRPLQWDPVTETFVGDEEADKKLSRPRRKGYELPEVL